MLLITSAERFFKKTISLNNSADVHFPSSFQMFVDNKKNGSSLYFENLHRKPRLTALSVPLLARLSICLRRGAPSAQYGPVTHYAPWCPPRRGDFADTSVRPARAHPLPLLNACKGRGVGGGAGRSVLGHSVCLAREKTGVKREDWFSSAHTGTQTFFFFGGGGGLIF